MIRSTPRTLCGCLLMLAVALADARAADWPHALGPDRTNSSAETGLEFAWPPDGPPRAWLKSALGVGYSGPAVVGDRVYLAAGRGDQEYLVALSLTTGEELWATPLGPLYRNDYGDGPRGTPTAFAEHIYALSGLGNLVCVERRSGRPVWRVSFTELGGEVPGWGYSESVFVDTDYVVCIPGGAPGGVVAFDRLSGALAWRCADWTDLAQYTSLTPLTIEGEDQLVVLSRDRVGGVLRTNGALRWQEPFVSSVVVTTSPLVQGAQVFVSASGGTGGKSLRLSNSNAVDLVYENKVLKSLANGLTLVDGNVYGYSEGRGWVCQEFATGQQRWASKAFARGSAVGVEERLICLSEDSGDVVLAAASPTGWRELHRFTLSPASQLRKPLGRIWTHPVVSQGRLLLRDQEVLHCFDLRSPQGRGEP